MTEIQSHHYTVPGSHNLRIPSREEFHRYATEKLVASDFCTEAPNGYLINKIAGSIKWTEKITRKGNYAAH